MLLSMTGQGVATASAEGTSVTVEMRAVNNRHLKINLRSPDSLIAYESAIEKQIRASVGRGTVNVNIKIEKDSRADDFRIDTALLESYRMTLEAYTGTAVSLEHLLTLPGIVSNSIQGKGNAGSSGSQLIEQAVADAISHFNQMRTVEGEALRNDLHQQLERLTELVESVRQQAPHVIKNYSDRITDKLNQLLEKHNITLTDADIVREIGLFADRCDITEELVRLDSHISQFNDVMNSTMSQGRKLDFITQELFREINTIGSKANDSLIASYVVEAKTVIERIREQVQNIQ